VTRWAGSRLRAAVGVTAGLALLVACTGGGSKALSDPDEVPPRQRGPATDVSVCRLIPAAEATVALDRPMHVVGVQYGPSRLPTLRCLLGDQFGVARLTVELATGPVSRDVFLEAYGESAGGDPVPVKRLGGMALLRNERDERILHVDVRGAILSLRLVEDPARPVPRETLLGLARSALDEMPENPRLEGTAPGPRCGRVPARLIGAAVGIEPSKAVGFQGPDGSLSCSWASFPGSVDITVIADPDRIVDYERVVDADTYRRVAGLGGRVTAVSRVNRPGDLMIFDGRRSMALISVTPSAGYADNAIVTTPAEIALGRATLKSLM
jgi:hypothetical protein